MNGKEHEIRLTVGQFLLVLFALAVGAFGLLQYWFEVLTVDERESFVKGIMLCLIILPLIGLLATKFLKKISLDKVDKFGKTIEQRSSKHPLLWGVIVIILPFAVGCGISFPFRLIPGFCATDVHEWVAADYIAAFLLPLFLISLVIAYSKHYRRQKPK